MALWEIALVVLALLAILWTFGVIWFMRGLGQTVGRIDRLLGAIEADLGPVLAEAKDTARNLNRASAGVAAGVSRAARTIESVQDLSRRFQGASAILHMAAAQPLVTFASFFTGVRMGVRALRRPLFRRR